MKSDFLLPKENIVDEVMTIIRWHVKNRDFVKKDQEFVEVETSKTILNLVSEKSGYIFCRANETEIVPVGSVLATFYSDLKELEADIKNIENKEQIITATESVENSETRQLSEDSSSTDSASTNFSKAALVYIREKKIDPALFKGHGLVTVQVLKQLLGEGYSLKKETATVMGNNDLKSEEISSSKKLEISLLTEGQSGKINSSLTVQFKSEKIRRTLEKSGTFNGQIFNLVLFELSRLLEEFPKFTAYYYANHIYYYDRINIGIAMDMEKGLKVVVLKDANKLSNTQLVEELTNKGISYLEDKLSIDDLSGGTVTVTDLSNDGILYFQPLINKKQSVILGIGGDGGLGEYPMTLTIVFDHRVLTGREVSIFLNKLKGRLLSYEL